MTWFFATCFWMSLAATGAAAQGLVADMSSDSISITSNFTGQDILLFGAVDGPSDVVVVVEGPREDLVIRRKAKVGGIWMNRASVTFQNVPAYYAVASSGPIEDIAVRAVRARHRMGGAYLDLTVKAGAPDMAFEELAEFRQAVLRNKRREELYFEAEGSVRFRERLFRTSIVFPANAPEGDYTVHTYLLRSGRVVDQQSSPLAIRKAGLERTIFDLAHDHPALYGIIAILIALASGWIAAAVFRRR